MLCHRSQEIGGCIISALYFGRICRYFWSVLAFVSVERCLGLCCIIFPKWVVTAYFFSTCPDESVFYMRSLSTQLTQYYPTIISPSWNNDIIIISLTITCNQANICRWQCRMAIIYHRWECRVSFQTMFTHLQIILLVPLTTTPN